MNKLYSVNHWGSHPDAGNDDCWNGDDFATEARARVIFNEPVTDAGTAYVVLEGPGVRLVRRNPDYVPSRDDDSWMREQQIEAAMLGGIAAYNAFEGV